MQPFPKGDDSKLKLEWALILFSSIFASSGCGTGGNSDSRPQEVIYVSAASSLQFVFPQIAQRFEEQSGFSMVLSYGASGSITQQIRSGAPIDLFCSADQDWIETLDEEGLLRSGSVECYATGILVLARPSGEGTEMASFEKALEMSIERLGISNPLLSPYGNAAREALSNRGRWEELSKKAVYGENVSHVLAYLEQGNVDLGFLPLSLAGHRKLSFVVVPSDFYSPIRQYLGIPVSGENPEGAETFSRFLRAAEAQAMLIKFGFGPAEGPRKDESGEAVAE